MNDIRKAKAKRHEQQWHTAVESLLPILPTLENAGDTVAKYLLLFIRNAKEVGIQEMRKHCNFDWKVSDVGMDRMSVFHQSRTMKTPYFSIERIYVEKGTYDGTNNVSADEKFRKVILDRVRGYDVVKDSAMALTMLILGPMLKQLAPDTDSRIVEFKEDAGLHLVFQESDNPNLFLKVFIGVAFEHPNSTGN
jgi:hypothetical protein